MTVIPVSGVNWGFQAADVLSNSAALVSALGGFVLLSLAVGFAPDLIRLIKGVFVNDSEEWDGEEEDE